MSVNQPMPNHITRTTICVDNVESFDFSGILYNPYMPDAVKFNNSKDIIFSLENFFDEMGFPQKYFELRAFNEKDTTDGAKPAPAIQRYIDNDALKAHTGKVATFEVEVRHRKSATWQGDFRWLEGQFRAVFSSTLELLLLMDKALCVISDEQ